MLNLHNDAVAAPRVAFPTAEAEVARALDTVVMAGEGLVAACHTLSRRAGWWDGPHSDLTDPRTVPTKLCLIHSEISEAMEGHRKGLVDDKLPHRSMLGVELADAVIRIADLAGAAGIPLGEIIAEKLAFNMSRPDHRPEARAAAGGKAY